MQVELAEVLWLDQSQQLSLAELADFSGLSESELQSLADFGVIKPVDETATEWVFPANCLVTARTASRLRSVFELDAQALTLTLTLLQHIEGLEAQVCELRAQLPLRMK